MINIGVQYYRAPFPDSKYWEDDFAQIADSGLNTVQLWVVWAWVEPAPGKFIYDDYDRLVELADKNGLGVVLSTIAAIHPYWIHREVPGNEMVDNMGHKVISSNRGECHFGLTPGGCLDHPGVWERMSLFLKTTVRRYRGVSNLRGWDAWNELRWNVQADGLVCYCPYTLNAYRAWLDRKYGGLQGLNEAWKRRYQSWEDVLPGKMPNRPYTEMMAFQHFITWRATEHGKKRFDLIKSLDPDSPVTVHGAIPTVLHGNDSYPNATALHRGNDWSFADHMDGIGCSSFPIWQGADDADYTTRIDYLTAAARNKRAWLSEVQGGRAASGGMVHQPVPAARQQRWLWTGISGGADTILFWCWRDEVFGRESSGFGMSGNDGLASERLAAMRHTAQVLRQHSKRLLSYKPHVPKVGILFSPQTYYQHWAQDGSATVPQQAIQGYSRALVRRNIPYKVVEEEHLDALSDLKVLFLPRLSVTSPELEEALATFVGDGGLLVSESECGAFAQNGLYRYPEDRFLHRLTGVREMGRRALRGRTIKATVGGRNLSLAVTQWLTPFVPTAQAQILAQGEDGPLMVSVPVKKGRVVLCGAYLGEAYYLGSSRRQAEYSPFCVAFEDFLASLVTEAGVTAPAEVLDPKQPTDSLVHVKTGTSAGSSLAFVFVEDPDTTEIRLRFQPGFFKRPVRELLTDQQVKLTAGTAGDECSVTNLKWGIAVLAEEHDA